MKDERFTELLGKKLAGELSPEESVEFGDFIAARESYRDEYESLKSYWMQEDARDRHTTDVLEKIKIKAGIVAEAPRQSVTSAPETAVYTDQKTPDQQKVRTLYPRLRGIAAVAAIALLSFGIYQAFIKGGTDQELSAVHWKRFHTPNRIVSNLILPDGSKVTLNAASSIRYPAKFTGDTRDVYLTGEAYLDVTHDSKRPFVLHTEKMDIHVLGTAFNVKSYAPDSMTEATLFRGSIAVTFPDHPDTRLMIKPSEKVVLTNSGYTRTKTDFVNGASIETMWMDGKLVFHNEVLGSIAASMARKYDVKVQFKNQSVKNLKFSGSFDKESLEEALNSLRVVTPFDYTIKGDTVYFY